MKKTLGFILITILFMASAFTRQIKDVLLSLGNGIDENITIEADIGAVTNPLIRWNSTDEVWEQCGSDGLCTNVGGGIGGSRLNLVEYPSYEEEKLDEITCTNATAEIEETIALKTANNQKSVKLTATADNAFCIVDKTVDSNWHTGLGIVKFAWFRTSASDATFVSRIDGSDETLTKTIPSSDKWESLKLRTTSGTTSNGYKINLATNGDIVYFDEQEIRPLNSSDQDYISEAHFVGSLNYASANCSWQRNNLGWGDLTVDNDCVASNIVGDVAAPDTAIPGVKLLNVRTDGYYSVKTQCLFIQSIASQSRYQLSASSSYDNNQGTSVVATDIAAYGETASGDFRFDSSVDQTVRIIASPSGGAFNIPSGSSVGENCKFSVYFYPDSKSAVVQDKVELTAETANEFSAKVNSNGTIIDSNLDWIEDCTVSDTSLYTCNYKPGIFEVAPVCTTSVNRHTWDSNGADRSTHNTTGVDALRVRTFYFLAHSNAVKQDFSFNVTCIRASDFNKSLTVNAKLKASNVKGGVDYGVENNLIAGYASFGGATDGSICSSSPCTRYREVGELAENMSVTRTGTGHYSVTVTGFEPNSSVKCDVTAGSTFALIGRVKANDLISDGSGNVTFQAITTALGGDADSYFQVDCKGPRP